jgi:hypothetical protein
MILRSSTSATIGHALPAASTDVSSGFYAVRPIARYDTSRIELEWNSVDEAVMAGIRQHYQEHGQRGKPFPYSGPAETVNYIIEAWYQYDSELTIQRTGPRRINMRVAVRMSLAYD